MAYPWTKHPKKWYVNFWRFRGNDALQHLWNSLMAVETIGGHLHFIHPEALCYKWVWPGWREGNGPETLDFFRCLKIVGPVFLWWFWEKVHFFDPRSYYFVLFWFCFAKCWNIDRVTIWVAYEAWNVFVPQEFPAATSRLIECENSETQHISLPNFPPFVSTDLFFETHLGWNVMKPFLRWSDETLASRKCDPGDTKTFPVCWFYFYVGTIVR